MPKKKRTKRCPSCERHLSVDKFHKITKGYDGLQSQCKECKRIAAAASKHNVDADEIRRLLRRGRCAVCLRKRPLSIDHNHYTGKIRGAVCRQCNSALGFLSDDPVWVAALLGYIQTTDPHSRVRLQECQEALLSLFALVDTVFTSNDEIFRTKDELDAMSKKDLRATILEQQKSLGQLMREWKACRQTLDPDFDPDKFDRRVRPRRWLPAQVRRAKAQARSSSGRRST